MLLNGALRHAYITVSTIRILFALFIIFRAAPALLCGSLLLLPLTLIVRTHNVQIRELICFAILVLHGVLGREFPSHEGLFSFC